MSKTAQHIFYVATNGNDACSGKNADPDRSGTDGPLATLERAVEISRNLDTTQPRRIIVLGGEYFETTVDLNWRDSGLTIEAARDEEPVLYGGRLIAGWKPDGDRFWSADVPGALETDSNIGKAWDFRMLVVNGESRPRARLPKEGAFSHESKFDVRWMRTAGGGWERRPTQKELTTMKYVDSDLGDWLNIRNAEVIAFHAWNSSLVRLRAIDTENRILTFMHPGMSPPGAFWKSYDHARTYVVLNVREGMHEPGQWYLDRSRGKVVYWPLPGEDMAKTKVVAPSVANIIRINGDENDRQIRYLTITGLSLQVCKTFADSANSNPWRAEGAIVCLGGSSDCRFENLKISNVGGHGIKLRDRFREKPGYNPDRNRPSTNQRIRIEGCEIDTVGIGGIFAAVQDSVFSQNLIRNIGTVFSNGNGILINGNRNTIAHNELSNLPYCGINARWGIGSRIEHNIIRNCMQQQQDGGGIKTIFVEDFVIHGNVVSSEKPNLGLRPSYYLDEYSENCEVSANLSVNMSCIGLYHMSHRDRIIGNVFVTPGDALIRFPRSTEFALKKNVVYAGGKITVQGINAVDHFSRNIFYSGCGLVVGTEQPVYVPGTPAEPNDMTSAGSVEEIPLQSDGGTLLAEPMFLDVTHGDFRYAEQSPVHRLGITPLDTSRAGRSGRICQKSSI